MPNQKLIKSCQACGTSQKVKQPEKGISSSLCIKIVDKEVWLTAFTDVMEKLTASAGISVQSASTDEIAEESLQLEKN